MASYSQSKQNKITPPLTITNHVIDNKPDTIQTTYLDKVKLLINEVHSYISSVTSYSKLSADSIVFSCLKYDFDIPFLLAAGQIESCFGTAGKAKRTNSIFNLGSHDSGRTFFRYPNPNACIEQYINIVQSNFIRDRSINHVLRPGHFKNAKGKRYASCKKYETKLKTTRNRIIKQTNIEYLQSILNDLKHKYYFQL